MDMSLLEVQNLKTWYPVKKGLLAARQFVKAVDGVSFSLKKGETLGLVGESGCGKSTLGKTVIGLEKATSGSMRLDGEEILGAGGRKLRRLRSRIQMIFQDPYSSLNPRMSIRTMLDEVLHIHTRLNKKEREERMAELLKMVGLPPENMDRYPHQFSGGQRQRIGITRALAVNPELIIADEPVSALDVSVQAQIINLLEEIRERTQISYLFIAHDLAVVEHISHRIMVMYLGRIVESGESHEICRSPAHPYTRALLSAVPVVEAKTGRRRIILEGDIPSPINQPSGCHFHPRCPMATEKCRTEAPPLAPLSKDKSHNSACFYAEKVMEKMP